MAKHDERHLTTEQLSAFIDKELSEQELADFNTHLQTCEQCQATLASLQQAVAFLHALPQPALPRSFALPAGVSYLQERPEGQAQPIPGRQPVRRPSWRHNLQRSLRAASMIAAVIGLVFLLSSILPTLHSGGGAASTSSGPNAPIIRTAPGGVDNGTLQPAFHTKTPRSTAPAAPSHQTPAVVAHTPTAVITKPSSPSQPSAPLLDLGTALGRQELGFILLALGIIGVLLTRRMRREREPT